MFFETSVTSVTGNLCYSHQVYKPCQSSWDQSTVPFLNKLSNVFLIGRVAGVFRAIIVAIHITAHLLASVATRKLGHLCHVAAGFAELLRSIIEMIPIIGEIFSWIYNPAILVFMPSHYCDDSCAGNANFFLIKVCNPEDQDSVDRAFARQPSKINSIKAD